MPCGTHKGVRTTFVDSPASIWRWKLPRPLPFHKAVDLFEKTGEVTQGIAIPMWEYAARRPRWQAKKDVDDKRNSTIDAYADSIGIGGSCLQAAYDFSLWSACAEFLH